LSDIRSRLRNAARDLVRRDLSLEVRALRLGQRVLGTVPLAPHFALHRHFLVELSAPPRPIRGLRDLVIRRGGPGDIDALCAIDDSPLDAVHRRLGRGDIAFVGELEGRVLCKTWFHRGPEPYDDSHEEIVAWALRPSTFWSYNGAAAGEAMATGLFVKMFSTALRELFEREGAERIQGSIRDTNGPSLNLHDKLGFARVGTMISVFVPGAKWLRWEDGGGTRQWLVRRSRPLALSVPPA
jgi:hypothetical protein